MTDVAFAHVSGAVWRNQIGIAPDASSSIQRIAFGRDARHDKAPRDYVLSSRTQTLPFRNFHGSAGTSPLASTTVFFALIRKIALTRMTSDWAKECKLEFQIARCSLLPVLLSSGGNSHRLHSRARNTASAIGLRILSIRRRNCAPP
jgi:hypothetical protein